MKVVRIANAAGYWGDDPDAFRTQVEGGRIDYLTADYLAEITMVILQKMQAADPAKGWALDFVPSVAPVLRTCLEKRIRIVTNAGGVNPRGCAAALAKAAAKQGLTPRIAVVDGAGVDAGALRPPNADTGEAFDRIVGRVASAHAYLGARGIVEALAGGADIVIAGRVADASLTLGPVVHEHGWDWDDWDRLAAGTVAGHVLECGAHATGGNLTDWRSVPELLLMGYPVAEVGADGSVVITKHAGSGGRVSRATVVEQLLYEIGDPAAYLTPDVSVDFRFLEATEEEPDRVRIAGARGAPPPKALKAGICAEAGFKAAGTYLFGPPDSREKAEAMARLVWARTGTTFDAVQTELVGGECGVGDALLRLAVRDADRAKVEAFSRRFASFALSGPPGVTIPGGGRPPVLEVFEFWPALVPRESVSPVLILDGEERAVDAGAPAYAEPGTSAEEPPPSPAGTGPFSGVPLSRLAFGRSGDKGDLANIGVAARSKEDFEVLRRWLTPELVTSVFRAEVKGRVTRYELPGLRAFNFVLEEALGGGGVLSLRSDPQGKLFAQRLLATELP